MAGTPSNAPTTQGEAAQPAARAAPAAMKEPAGALQVGLKALSAELMQDLQIELDGDTSQQIGQARSELDLGDTNSILFFGSKAQQQLSTVSETMLEKVRTKDVGPAGDLLNTMVQRLKQLDVPDSPGDRPNFLARLLGARSEIEKFLDRYEDVRGQIEEIAVGLEKHKTQLLTDVVSLDKLYDANLDYFRTLEVYIAAGRAALADLDQDVIPKLAAEVEKGEDVIETQKLRDLRASRDDLERRVHDLLLTRTVTMQSLPSIRLVQENDKSLIGKINSTLANTVPLWKQQLAQAVTIHNSGKAAGAVKAATDLTNELLRSNAENLRTINAEVRSEAERGVFDLATIKQANAELIGTIEDSLRIADEGKAKRAAAERELQACEAELRKALASASARAQGGAPATAAVGSAGSAAG